jgi:hypothetical protein
MNNRPSTAVQRTDRPNQGGFPAHAELEEVSTMKYRIAGASLVAALLVGSSLLAAELKSGPQVGSSNLPAFNPLHCSGSGVGGKACLV